MSFFAEKTALERLLKEEGTDSVHPRELDMLTGAELKVYDVKRLFDKVPFNAVDEIKMERGCMTPPPASLAGRPKPVFYSPQLSDVSSNSDMFRSSFSSVGRTPPAAKSSARALQLTSTLVEMPACADPGSPCSQLKDTLSELKISVGDLHRWTEARAEREHEIFHRLGHLHTSLCQGAQQHHHHVCPQSLSGVLPSACQPTQPDTQLPAYRLMEKEEEEERQSWVNARARQAAKVARKRKNKASQEKDRRLEVADKPRKLKPWERAALTANLPSSSSGEDEPEEYQPGVERLHGKKTSSRSRTGGANAAALDIKPRILPLPSDNLFSFNYLDHLPRLPSQDDDENQGFSEEKIAEPAKVKAEENEKVEKRQKRRK